MWAGVPVVATDAGGLPEAVGEGGRVVKSGDAQALAEAMIAALKDTADTQRMNTLARARVDREFSANSLADGTLAVYNELVTVRPAHRAP
jgi:glycosyltransferase involved in cell wall biosynthesis